MLTAFDLLAGLAFIGALLLLSSVEVALGGFSRIAARKLIDNPTSPSAPRLGALMERRSEILLSLQILVSLVIAGGAAFLFRLFERLQFTGFEGFAATIISTLATVLLVQHLIPRFIASKNAEGVLLRGLPLLRFVYFTMRPFSKVVMGSVQYFHHLDEEAELEKEEEASEEEIRAFIDAGEEEGILESDEGEMIQSIVHFGDKIVREVMTPRTQIAAIDVASSVEQLVQLIVMQRRTRVPVYRDTLDNIEGFVHERDVLQMWQRGDRSENFRPLVKAVTFVPETKAVDDLLQEMRYNGDQMVIVVDEYGGVSGLVTMKDLLEEIVGDIREAGEPDEDKIVEESGGVYVVPGSLELGTLEEKLGLTFLNDTESTTVAGAVVELLGRLPAAGEKLEHQGLQIEVLDADRRRVHRLRIKTPVHRSMTG